MASNDSDNESFVLTVRYTVEYTVEVEGTEDQVRRFADELPTPSPSSEDPWFIEMLTGAAKSADVVVSDMTDPDVCGGYVDTVDGDGDQVDRVYFD